MPNIFSSSVICILMLAYLATYNSTVKLSDEKQKSTMCTRINIQTILSLVNVYVAING